MKDDFVCTDSFLPSICQSMQLIISRLQLNLVVPKLSNDILNLYQAVSDPFWNETRNIFKFSFSRCFVLIIYCCFDAAGVKGHATSRKGTSNFENHIMIKEYVVRCRLNPAA